MGGEIDVISRDITRLKKRRTNLETEVNQLVESRLGQSYGLEEEKAYQTKKKFLTQRKKEVTDEIEKQETKKSAMYPSYEKNLNLLQTLSQSYATLSAERKLEIANKVYSNIYIDHGKVVQATFNSPFDVLFKPKVLNGSKTRQSNYYYIEMEFELQQYMEGRYWRSKVRPMRNKYSGRFFDESILYGTNKIAKKQLTKI